MSDEEIRKLAYRIWLLKTDPDRPKESQDTAEDWEETLRSALDSRW